MCMYGESYGPTVVGDGGCDEWNYGACNDGAFTPPSGYGFWLVFVLMPMCVGCVLLNIIQARRRKAATAGTAYKHVDVDGPTEP